MEDATLDNGCLLFAPGSQHLPLKTRFVRKADNKSTEFIQVSDVVEPNESEYIPVPVKAGSLVLINGSVYHKSGPNNSEKSRWIYTFHVIEGNATYSMDNWLQPTPEMPFSKLFR
jgi:phytanoyl-CoA hydroxylase